MSLINLFHAQSSPKTETVSTVDVPSERNWRSEPISVRQIVAVAKFFRGKNLLAETDPTWLAMFAKLAVYDGETKSWPMVERITKGDASDLMDRLHGLPWQSSKPGFGEVKTATASPKPKPVELDPTQSIPEGWVVVIGKNGRPYFAKAK